MSDAFQGDEIDQQLEQIYEKAHGMLDRCLFRSARNLNAELARLARSNERIMPYLHGRFFEMTQAQDVLEPHISRERAIELIAILENEDQARTLQSDFPQEQYEFTVGWMTACVYENLAEATAMSQGFNSDGMHQCIADGLLVCRRTGKMQCVSCFREYATDVYTAADDLTMARHQCESILARQGGWSTRGDRRWYASMKLGWLHVLEGHLDRAEAAYAESRRLTSAEEVSMPAVSRLRLGLREDELNILQGKPRHDFSADDADASHEWPLPDGEWPFFEHSIRTNDALAAACAENRDEAIGILTELDRQYSELKCLELWFEVRLRLIAATLLSGDARRGDRLATQLREKATAAGEFLTLRRLDRLFAGEATPIAALAAGTSEAVSENNPVAPAPAVAEDPGPDKPDDADEGPSEVQKQIFELMQQYFQTEDPEEEAALVTRYLTWSPETVTNPRDVLGLMHFAAMLQGDGTRVLEIWKWAQEFSRPFIDEPSVLSSIATLADALRHGPGEEIRSVISAEWLEKQFRLTLSMNANRFGNHMRAAEFFLGEENFGEAERCFARAFRLDRTSSAAALRLSQVYQATERPRDAINALDLCLREGTDDAAVAWEALVLSVAERQFDAAMTYADRFTELNPEPESWLEYYRALALIGLKRFDEAVEAIDREAEVEHEETYGLDIVRTCALFGLNRTDEAAEQLRVINKTPLTTVTELTFSGLCRLYELLWEAVSSLDANDQDRQDTERVMVAAALAPESYFDAIREQATEEGGIGVFRCLLEQHLDHKWRTATGCLHGQEEWTSYCATWGVLARDEEEAVAIVRKWQNRCQDGEIEVLETIMDDGGYREKPGIIWQGGRWHPAPPGDGPEEP